MPRYMSYRHAEAALEGGRAVCDVLFMVDGQQIQCKPIVSILWIVYPAIASLCMSTAPLT